MNILASGAVQETIRWGIILLFGFPVTFTNDVTEKLDEHKIKYEFVKDLGRGGEFVFSTQMIRLDESLKRRPSVLRGVAAHEVIHLVRDMMGIDYWANQRFEEAVAVYGCDEVSKLLGFGQAGTHEFITFKRTMRANNLEYKKLTREELKEVRREIKRTVEQIKKLYDL